MKCWPTRLRGSHDSVYEITELAITHRVAGLGSQAPSPSSHWYRALSSTATRRLPHTGRRDTIGRYLGKDPVPSQQRAREGERGVGMETLEPSRITRAGDPSVQLGP